MRWIVFTLLYITVNASQQSIIQYFNDRYRKDSIENYDITFQIANAKYRAQIGDFEWSKWNETKEDAEFEAVKEILSHIGGKKEMQVAEKYDSSNTKYSKYVDLPTEYRYQQDIGFSQSQQLEFETPEDLIGDRMDLQNHIKYTLAKHASAFLNAQSKASDSQSPFVILFGITEEGLAFGHSLTQSERDLIEIAVDQQLNRITNQNFIRKVQWQKIKDCPISLSYILEVTIWKLPGDRKVYAILQRKDDFSFWIRRAGPVVNQMSFKEIENAFLSAF